MYCTACKSFNEGIGSNCEHIKEALASQIEDDEISMREAFPEILGRNDV